MSRRIRRSIKAQVLIHNDLERCASWYSQLAERKEAGEVDRKAIALDIQAALVFLAFGVEARVNFVGWKMLGEGWPERASFWEKVALLAAVLKLEVDRGLEPWQTISQLKRFRDTLAHGKPEIIERDETLDEYDDEYEDDDYIFRFMKPRWDEFVSIEFLRKADAAASDVATILMESSGIRLFDAMTHAQEVQTVL